MMEMYKKPGEIVSKIRKRAVDHIEADMKIIDIIEFVEGNIIEMGGKPAFPCNISINEITAHYTSPPGDESIIKTGDLVKIDLGAHVNGYIADSAVSVLVGVDDQEFKGDDTNPSSDSNEYSSLKMIETAKEALENAISTVRDGVEIGKIGQIIEETINNRGFNSVSNLTGHSMDRWILHAGLSIPNIKEKNIHKIQEGDVIAIEPFVTNGVGRVGDINDVYIFKFLRNQPMRMVLARKLLNTVSNEYRSLPFAQRWIAEKISSKQLNMAMRQLIASRAVYPYHVLKEKSDARVAQAEHTVIVEADGCTVITE